MSKYFPCPCGTKLLYHKCCKKFHDGELPENALLLMRSRYSAYALGLADYLIETTHPDFRRTDTDAWRDELVFYSRNSKFQILEIADFTDGEDEAFVTFSVRILHDSQDVSFTEKSRFAKLDGRWLYKDGDVRSLPRFIRQL